jgi:SAM-dependent methyltransferase
MNWRIKGLVQKTLSSMPGGTRLNDLLQRSIGDMRDFEAHLTVKVKDWAGFAARLKKLNVAMQGLRIVEVGTGWFPTLPVCFSLAGASTCVTFDLKRHLNDRLTRRMLEGLQAYLPFIADLCQREVAEIQSAYDKINRATSTKDVLGRASIEYFAPANAARSGLPDNSVDMVFSNSVLEHVPAGVISELLLEGNRILRPGGVAIHTVNCGDHYAYFDPDITPINYLNYSENRWRFWNNGLLFQNRLRPRDIIELATQSGMEIIFREQTIKRELIDKLGSLPISREFAHYSPEELCSTSVTFAGKKQPDAAIPN